VVPGEPIRPAQLAAKEAGNGLAALIPTHMRAMAVRVDDVVGVAGFIHPDDRVDVIVILRPSRPVDAEPTSKVILQNVKVLAVGKELEIADQARRQANPATVATLLVNPQQAEKLALAANEGRLVLTLRSWTDTAAVATAGSNATNLLSEAGAVMGAAGTADAPHADGAGAGAPAAASSAAANAPGAAAAAAARAAALRKRRSSPVAHAGGPPGAKSRETVEILRGDRFEERKFDPKVAVRK
jgi:pilus assembly protein CpaB